MGVVAACTAPCWSLDVHSPPESRTGGNADTQTVLAASAVDKCSRIDGRTRQGTEPAEESVLLPGRERECELTQHQWNRAQ
mgnify:CR=1 FL=1